MNNYTIKELENVCPTWTRRQKMRALKKSVDTTRYNIIGFVDRTCTAVLEPRFYNVRDSLGRFARVRSKR